MSGLAAWLNSLALRIVERLAPRFGGARPQLLNRYVETSPERAAGIGRGDVVETTHGRERVHAVFTFGDRARVFFDDDPEPIEVMGEDAHPLVFPRDLTGPKRYRFDPVQGFVRIR
jgi:hypothetical protein